MAPSKHKDLQHEALQEVVYLIQGGELPTEEQINALRTCLIKDRIVSTEEAEVLFYIKRQAEKMAIMRFKHQGYSAIPGFDSLFVDAITSNILFTGETPGVLDTIEFIWLSDHITEDYNYDSLERSLLLNIARKAEKLPANFHDLAKNFARHIKENETKPDATTLEDNMSFLDKLKSLLTSK